MILCMNKLEGCVWGFEWYFMNRVVGVFGFEWYCINRLVGVFGDCVETFSQSKFAAKSG